MEFIRPPESKTLSMHNQTSAPGKDSALPMTLQESAAPPRNASRAVKASARRPRAHPGTRPPGSEWSTTCRACPGSWLSARKGSTPWRPGRRGRPLGRRRARVGRLGEVGSQGAARGLVAARVWRVRTLRQGDCEAGGMEVRVGACRRSAAGTQRPAVAHDWGEAVACTRPAWGRARAPGWQTSWRPAAAAAAGPTSRPACAATPAAGEGPWEARRRRGGAAGACRPARAWRVRQQGGRQLAGGGGRRKSGRAAG